MVCRAITAGQTRTAWERVEELTGIFPDRFYLELQRHGIGAQDRVNAELSKMAIDLKLPLLATNDAHYLEQGDHRHHEALLCIGTGTKLDDPKRFRFDGEGFYLKSGDEMAELFHDHPSAVRNTLELAERCALDLDLDSGSYHLPEFQVPSDTTREAVLEEQTQGGLRRRLGLAPDEPIPPRWGEYAKRVESELAVINSMGFAGYFLIVADFIDYARRHGIPVGPGRGSSAGSLVAYSLGITGIDPIEYDIIFERFLNPERISMPDIDVDFCMRGRDQVIRYVADKYDSPGLEGKRVAQIITFGKLQARAAISDVGRVLGMPFGEVDRLVNLIPETLGISLDEAIEQSPELRSRMEADGQVSQLIETARRLEGLTRHASTHAAGVVIGTRPLIETVPIYRDSKSGDLMTQFDMRCVEKIGLIKFDFLGLRTLTTLADAEARIRASGAPDFSIEAIPLDDSKTYDLLGSGDSEGIFQIESGGMTDLTVKLRPRSLQGADPDRRPLPPRAARLGHGGRLRQPQARGDEGRVPAARAGGAHRRDARRDRVPGPGAPDREPACRLQPGRGRPAAPRDGQEEARGDGEAARPLPERLRRARHRAAQGRGGLRADGGVRGLRLRQVALRGLRADHLPDGLPEGEPSARVPGGAAHHRGRQSRQAGALHRARAPARDPGAGARTRTSRRATSRWCRRGSASAWPASRTWARGRPRRSWRRAARGPSRACSTSRRAWIRAG